jgi:hypothetical protein
MSRHKQREAPRKLVRLSAQARQRLVRPFKDFEQYVEPMLALYEAHGKALGGFALDPDALRAALTEFRALAADERAAEEQLALVKSTRLLRSSTVWSGVLEIYARGRWAARTNPAIKKAISDFQTYMKRPRKKRAKRS